MNADWLGKLYSELLQQALLNVPSAGVAAWAYMWGDLNPGNVTILGKELVATYL